jgi:hypothetical protein
VAAKKGGSRRLYTLTEAGSRAAREWLKSRPVLPPVDSELVARLLADDMLLTDELFATLLELRGMASRARVRPLKHDYAS